jgi:hypothetical protein
MFSIKKMFILAPSKQKPMTQNILTHNFWWWHNKGISRVEHIGH